MDIKMRAEKNKALAEDELASMRSAATEEEAYGHLVRYIRLRYLLEDDPYWDDDIVAYTKYSIRKTMEQAQDPAKLTDLGINCAGASSATTKHLLLLISIRKGLDIELDPEQAATARTVRQLAGIVYAQIEKTRI